MEKVSLGTGAEASCVRLRRLLIDDSPHHPAHELTSVALNQDTCWGTWVAYGAARGVLPEWSEIRVIHQIHFLFRPSTQSTFPQQHRLIVWYFLSQEIELDDAAIKRTVKCSILSRNIWTARVCIHINTHINIHTALKFLESGTWYQVCGDPS